MLYIENKENPTYELNRLIEQSRNFECKGPELADIHYKLGTIIGKRVPQNNCDTVVMFLMRAGMFMAEAIFRLNPNAAFIPIVTITDVNKYKQLLAGKRILLVDSVINTGKSLLTVLNELEKYSKDITIITNVIYTGSKNKFSNFDVYAIRESNHSYVGTGGVDTGNRLFNTIS